MRQAILSFAAPCLLALSSLLVACGGQSEPEPSAGAGSAGAGIAGSGGAGSGGAGSGGVGAGSAGAGFGGQYDPGGCKPSSVKRCVEGKIVDTSCCSGPFNDSCMPMPIATCADGSCAPSASQCPGGQGGAGAGGGGQGGGGSSNGPCSAPDYPSTVTRCVGGKLSEIPCCAGPFNDSCMPSPILTCADGSCAEAFQGCPGGQGGGGAGGGAGACGAEPPAKGAPCEAGQECAWGDRVGLCGADGWFIGHKTGVQLAPDAPCNPLGRWDLSYEPSKPEGFFCTEPGEPDLEVRAAKDGGLVADFAGGAAAISADGCHIKADVSQSYTNPSESWSASTGVDLTLAGDQGSGTYSKSNGGFCNGKQQGKLSAKRL